MKVLVFVALMIIVSPAYAEGLTVSQCLGVYMGVNSLNYAGQALGDNRTPPSDAKQYKLGELRGTLSFDLAALQTVYDSVIRARTSLWKENGITPDTKPDSPAMAKFLEDFQKVLDRPCDAKLTRIKLEQLRLGDDANAIPLNVLSALEPIIDR